MLVETPDEVDRLEIADDRKVAYLTQTTLSVDDANRNYFYPGDGRGFYGSVAWRWK